MGSEVLSASRIIIAVVREDWNNRQLQLKSQAKESNVVFHLYHPGRKGMAMMDRPLRKQSGWRHYRCWEFRDN